LPVEKAERTIEKILWDLYEVYSTEMKLNVPFHPSEILGDKEIAEFKYPGAYIESKNLSNQFIFKGRIKKGIRDNKPVLDMQIESSKWEVIK